MPGPSCAQATICPVETFFITLLAISSLLIVWFAAYVVYRLVRSVR